MERLCGGASWNRTSDTRIFSPLLYQLSYGTVSTFLKTVTVSLCFCCGASWNRTSDTRIFSRLLYQLSYGTVSTFLKLLLSVYVVVVVAAGIEARSEARREGKGRGCVT